jgi:hypothetical protein
LGFGATVVVRGSVPALAFGGTVPTINGEKNATQPAQSPTIASYFSGGTTPYVYDLQSGTLQAGLALNVATGAIVGTPTATGTQAIVIRATDAASATASTNSFNVVVAADTTPPTLTGPTGTQSGTSTATGSVSTNDPGGTLYRLASTNATESAATVKAAALSQAVTATGAQAVSFTGLSAGTYYLHFVHTDPDGNDSARVSSTSFVMLSDVESPVWPGGTTLVPSSVTTSGFVVTASAAPTDNVGVTAIETSFDGGTTYELNTPPTGLSATYSGGSPGAVVQVRMRAYDAVGNVSTLLSLNQTLTNTSVSLGPCGSSGTYWPNGTAVLVNWFPGWRAGDPIPENASVRSVAVVGSGGMVPVTGLPVGAGGGLITRRFSSADTDKVSLDFKTVV